MLTPLGPLSFGLADLGDIVATSVLVYYLLLLIRDTRAAQIVTGLVVLAVVFALANAAHLLVLATIMQYLLLGTAVTLPIVFQPELRRALEQIVRGRFFRAEPGEVRAGSSEAIAILARAAFSLSAGRTGALIVIEQSTGLKEYAESGTRLGARLSSDLLAAIFTPLSPLHDGAVIVREMTVEAAACFLPLSEKVIADRHLGTRHRAAVGLSEVTDAVVLVVSEQTGKVSVARDGRLSVAIDDRERLERALSACVRTYRSRQAGDHRLANARLRRRGVTEVAKELQT